MRRIELDAGFFAGAVSVEAGAGWLKPWRLPWEQRQLFLSPGDGWLARAACTSGVRLRFATAASQVRLSFEPLPAVPAVCLRETFVLDATVDGEIVASARVPPGGDEALFSGLPAGDKVVELWLPPEVPIAIRALEVEEDGDCRPASDPRPAWVTYGSSLTHCVRAHGSARIWPATVARRRGLNLTALGYGGECHLDPLVGLMIRDMPAAVITLKLGINCIGGSLNARTFPAAVMGLVRIIREKHPRTPIGLVSPIAYPPRETTPNAVGYTIGAMRQAIQDVQRRLAEAGDDRVFHFNGLDVFSLDLMARYSVDQCHPNADGIDLMAENFDRVVMAVLMPHVQAQASRRG